MLRTETPNDPKQPLLTRILREHFACADTSIIASVEAGADYLHLASGEMLFEQGEAQDDIFFVLSGRLRASATTPEGETKVLGEIGRGETIGELALFTGEPRSASVVALRDATVARLPRTLIERTIAQAPEMALSLTRLVIARFRQSQNERPRVAVPVNVCILPISLAVDALGFARALRARQPESLGSVAVVGTGQIGNSLGADPESPVWRRYGAVGRYLDELEQENAAVYLVADPDDSAWTRFCLKQADEIVLLGDANASPGLSAVETTLLGGEAPITIARRTLVLLHDRDARSPRGTARWLALRGRPRHFHIRPALEADMARMARIISGRAIGLVLAGGGARGFAHIGVYEALEEAGIEVDFIGGTSIGALMGTLIALDVRSTAARQDVHDAFLKHPKGKITGDYNFLPLLSLIKGTRGRDSLAAVVRHHVGDEIDMEDSWKTFFVIASNFSAVSEEVLASGPLVRNVTASFAIPGALPPVLMDGQLMFDGGTFNNFPVDVMAEMGVGKVIGVDLSSGDFGRRVDVQSIPGTLELLRDKLRPRARQRYRRLPTIPETMITSTFITSLSRQREQRRQADMLFRPRLPRIGLLDWHRFAEIAEAGRAHAIELLAGLGKEELAAYR